MLSNFNKDREIRSFIFGVLSIYSGWLASLCKIWEMSCQLFVRLLSLLTNGEEASANPAEQSKPAEAAGEVNTPTDERSAHEVPAAEQATSASAKAETSLEPVEVAKNVEASAETTEQPSSEGVSPAEDKTSIGSEISSNATEAEVEPKLETTSEPSTEEPKSETTSAPSVEETKLEALEAVSKLSNEETREEASEVIKDKCEEVSEPTEGKCETTATAEAPKVTETVESTSEPPNEGHISPTSPPEDLNETKLPEVINEITEANDPSNNPNELSSPLASEEMAEGPSKRLKKAKRMTVREYTSEEGECDDEFNGDFGGEPTPPIKVNKKSKSKRIGSKRKLVASADC
ncbi:MAG: hypothetical protein ACTS4W_00900 [Candidatus Hodgkinia cicadicola]